MAKIALPTPALWWCSNFQKVIEIETIGSLFNGTVRIHQGNRQL